jgi:subtilase family serine protease
MRTEKWWLEYVDRSLLDSDEFDRFVGNLDHIEIEQQKYQMYQQSLQLKHKQQQQQQKEKFQTTNTNKNVNQNNIQNVNNVNLGFPNNNTVHFAANTTNTYGSETTWSNGGGAVSNVYTRPSYQDNRNINTYRSTPDISLNADPATGVAFIVGGSQYIFGGTSVAAPTFAGYLASINYSKYNTQFANYKLYSAPSSCFHDIMSGSNGDYTASSGYDICTGLGSIVGNTLFNVLINTTVYIDVLNYPTQILNNTINVSKNTTYNLRAYTSPSTTKVTWRSSNTSIVSIDMIDTNNNCRITCNANGSATITATATDGSNISYTLNVNVLFIPLTNIILTGTTNMNINSTLQLSAIVLPIVASNKSLVWSSSNNNIISVNSTSLCKSNNIGGSAIITVLSQDGSGVSARLTITVIVPATSIILNNPAIAKKFTLAVTVVPSNASNKSIIWSTYPTKSTVATVNNGVVTVIGAGQATIIATSVSNPSVSSQFIFRY